MNRSRVLCHDLFEALRRSAQHSVTVASCTDSHIGFQAKLEALKIVKRREQVVTADAVEPSSKKKYSSVQRNYLKRRARRLAKEEVAGISRAYYVRGPNFKFLREIPLLGAVIDAFASSVVHQGGPCALLLEKAVLVAPPRFGLSVPAIEAAFASLKDISRPIAGTTGDTGEVKHRTACVRFDGYVMSGKTARVNNRLLVTLQAFDSLCTYLMRVIYECLCKWNQFGFKESVNATALHQAFANTFAKPQRVNAQKHIISVFYDPGATLNGHEDTCEVATFITTNTPNQNRQVLLNLADMESKVLKHEIAYHRWDLVFFPAKVWHQTSPYPSEREIMNIFY